MKYIFLLFMLLPIAGQVYISWQIWNILPLSTPFKISVVVLMVLPFFTFFFSMSGQLDKLPMSLATILYEMGTAWLIILLYLVILFLLLNVGTVLHLIPSSFTHNSIIGSLSIFFSMVVLFTYANIHYNNKKKVEITLTSEKKVSKPMKVVLISDMHLGYHNKRSDLHRWINLINKENPDAILIAGDIVDRSVRPILEEHTAEEFKNLNAPVYAIYGNHDYYTGITSDKKFCEDAGIHILQDSIVYIGDLAIVGRDDRTNPQRKSLSEVMQNIDRSKYIIELDHQPYHLEEAEQNKVDFEFAGHTHYGQVWPLSWITDAIYEDAFGPHQRGNTYYYVSSGLGIWGAKFRIGTQSEYIVATIK
ncbi:MAG: metallophosphoesterase [Phocaeicola sp.]|uniref:metallophosphoesterase n=1 Tax=Phocaeicola sp. TaxID=2773926 RepID=UPI003F9F9377